MEQNILHGVLQQILLWSGRGCWQEESEQLTDSLWFPVGSLHSELNSDIIVDALVGGVFGVHLNDVDRYEVGGRCTCISL